MAHPFGCELCTSFGVSLADQAKETHGDCRRIARDAAELRTLAAKPGLYPAFAVAVERARERMARPDWDASLAEGWVPTETRKHRSKSAEPAAPKIVG